MEYRGLTLTSENVSCVNGVFVMEVDDVVKTKEGFSDFFLYITTAYHCRFTVASFTCFISHIFLLTVNHIFLLYNKLANNIFSYDFLER
jgi:hypothetical protein